MFDGDLSVCELFDPELFRGAPPPTTAIALRVAITESGGVGVLESGGVDVREGQGIAIVEALV